MKGSPYLAFNGDCEKAFAFYENALGGKIVSMARHGGTPAETQVPPEWRDKIMHARLETGEFVLMGADSPPGRYARPSGFHITLQTRTPEEAHQLFGALADRAEVVMPIQKTFWSLAFGMLTDQFGIPWMVTSDAMAYRTLTLTRVFNAPREMIFKAWTDPKQLAKWWGPKGFTAPKVGMEVRPGGRLNVTMSGPPPWEDHPMSGEFKEVDAPRRLVFVTRAFADAPATGRSKDSAP